MATVGVLLAAGSGSRYLGDGHKLLAPLRGRPVAAWAIGAFGAARLDGHAVVVGAVDLGQLIPSGIAVIENESWIEGQATSLSCAVRYASQHGFDQLVIGLADQPFVPPSAWEQVASSVQTPIATATFSGQRRPPVRLASSVWPLLPREGDEGARLIMRAHPELVTVVPCQGEPIDIDTEEDLATSNSNDRRS